MSSLLTYTFWRTIKLLEETERPWNFWEQRVERVRDSVELKRDTRGWFKIL